MWFSKDIRYGEELGYVMLQLPAVALPPFTFDTIVYEPKEELHCSLLCTKKLAEVFSRPDEAEITLAKFIEQYCHRHAIEFIGFTPKAYVCQEGDVKSIVIGAEVQGVEELFTALRTQFSELTDLPPPALHVTLYKYNHRFGIGIQNEKQLKELCQSVPLSILPHVVREML